MPNLRRRLEQLEEVIEAGSLTLVMEDGRRVRLPALTDIDTFFVFLNDPAQVEPEVVRAFAASVPQPEEGAIVDMLRREFCGRLGADTT